jgi:uridylate kinase
MVSRADRLEFRTIERTDDRTRQAEGDTMSQLAAEIAKSLTVAALQAQPRVFDQDPKSSTDAAKLGREVADVFKTILDEIVEKVARLEPKKI